MSYSFYCTHNQICVPQYKVNTVNNYRQVTGIATGENFAFFIYRHFIESAEGFKCITIKTYSICLQNFNKVPVYEKCKVFTCNHTCNLHVIIDSVPKGQLNSERIYEVIVTSKIPTKYYRNFCHTL